MDDTLPGVAVGKELPYDSAMIVSKLTSKFQTTIPRPVRIALRVQEGDAIEYRVEGRHVVLTRHTAKLGDDPFKSFDEWDSDADRRAYAHL